MATIKDVVRNALIRIQKNGQVATPEIYQEAFIEEAKKLNIDVSQYNWKNAWLRKLDLKTRHQIQNFPIKTQEDFIGVLNAVIVRLSGQDNKEQLIYRDMLSMFLRHYAFTHPNENYHTLIKETKEFFDGVSSISPHTVRERWFQILKKDMPTESPNHEESSEEKEENLSFFAPLLRPSLIEKPLKQDKIQKAYNILQIDIQDVVKEELISAIDEAVQERVHIDKTYFNMIVKKNSKEFKKTLEVMMAKVSSVQIMGEMMFDEIEREKIKISEAYSKTDHKSVEELMLALITRTQERLARIKEVITTVNMDANKAVSKMGEENKKPITLAKPDTLTGVYTMDAIKDIIQYQEELYVEYDQNYSVFFVDIDRFAKVNEEHGKDSGDKILSTFGKLLKKIVREYDHVVRYDGEEFLVILSGMDHVESAFFAEKIRTQIEESIFVYGQHQMKITVSIGVADRKEGEFKQIVDTAKSRMQLAKKQGCNRIVS